jgi:hypothetical protein
VASIFELMPFVEEPIATPEDVKRMFRVKED